MRELKRRIEKLEQILIPEPSFRPGLIWEQDEGYCVEHEGRELRFGTLEEAEEFLQKQDINYFIILKLVSTKNADQNTPK